MYVIMQLSYSVVILVDFDDSESINKSNSNFINLIDDNDGKIVLMI